MTTVTDDIADLARQGVPQSLLDPITAWAQKVVIVHQTPLTLARRVQLRSQFWPYYGYNRHLACEVFVADAFDLWFWASVEGTGATAPFGASRYGLMLTPRWNEGTPKPAGTVVATCPIMGNEVRGGLNQPHFKGALPPTIPDGRVFAEIVALDASGNTVATPDSLGQFWMVVDRHGGAKDDPYVIFQTTSFDHTHDDGPVYAWMQVPVAMLKTRAVPLKPRTTPPLTFTHAATAAELVVENIVPAGDPDKITSRRPSWSARGFCTTENKHFYYFEDATCPIASGPRLPLIDGQRGEATVGIPLVLNVGHDGGVRGLNGLSYWLIDGQTGSKHTVAGPVHQRPPYWGGIPFVDPTIATYTENVAKSPELGFAPKVIWPASLPVSERYVFKSWMYAHDPRTLAIDPNSVLVGGEHTHVQGVVTYIGDGRGWIWKCTHDKADRFGTVTMEILVSGLPDLWGGCWKRGFLYASVRGLSAIAKIDPDKGAFTLLFQTVNPTQYGGPDSRTRFARAVGKTLADCRAVPLLYPEGCCATTDDTDPYVYFSSLAQEDVRRFSVDTLAVERCCEPTTHVGKVFYLLCQVSGTSRRDRFGPAYTLFTNTFSEAGFGRPEGFLNVPGNGLTHSQKWADINSHRYNVFQGQCATASGGYGMCCAVGFDWLVWADSSGAVYRMRLREPTDPVVDEASADRAAIYCRQTNFSLRYGAYGYGYIDEPLPWGTNTDLDKQMVLWGHSP